MRLEPVISHTGILMTFYLSIILNLQNFFHWYILQSWKLIRPQIPLRPHHFWTYTSNLTTVVKSILKFMINVPFIINFKIINLPNMCSNIPASPTYGVYIFAMQGTVTIFWFPETSSSSEKQATGSGLSKDSSYSIS